MRFAEVLATFSGFFDREGLRYALIGGLAMQAFGYSRFTRDVDFATEARGREQVVAFAESLGYETLHVSLGYSNHLHHDAAWGRVDFMYVDEATAAKLFPAASAREIVGNIRLLVPRPEHLAAMKATSMKNAPQRVLIDSPDVRFLLSLSLESIVRRCGSTLRGTVCWSCSMPSKKNRELIDFSSVPTTPEDLAMLEAVRALDRLDSHQYLEFLLAFSERHPPTREIPPRHEPFTL
jgi:hypothetical protein